MKIIFKNSKFLSFRWKLLINSFCFCFQKLGVRGQVPDTPRSPGPVQEDLEESPESPTPDLETPESPPPAPTTLGVVDTPMSPVADTPASPTPMDDTPASPDPDNEIHLSISQTPASPEDPNSDKTKFISEVKNDSIKAVNNKPDSVKVIPLERQISFQIKKKVEQTFDIRSPKDWHRGLRASSATSATSSTASPSSECSDDSEKGQKRLQIVESPTSSSPASPASGGEAAIAKPPSVLPLPTPIPSIGPPVPVGVLPPQLLKGLPLPQPSPSLPSPQPSQPQKPAASSLTANTSSQLHGHPSRPLRPSLPTGLPPAEQPKWKSQPRLTQPPPLAHPPPGLTPVGLPPGPIARPPFRPQHPQQFQHRLPLVNIYFSYSKLSGF